MRIIAGQWRSRRLLQPRTSETRPMPDRVKEAVFSILGTEYGTPGSLPALRVADLFAGSGSLGLEALSRGVSSCHFFECRPRALEVLRKNMDQLKVEANGIIITRDAWVSAADKHREQLFELIFLDPPYADSSDWSLAGRVPRLLAEFAVVGGVAPLIMLHHEARSGTPPVAPPWRVRDHRIYGTNAITFLGQ